MRMILLVVLLTLPGCAALKTAGVLTSLGGAASNGVELANGLTIGKKQETVAVDTHAGDRTSVVGTATINNVQDIPILWVLLFTLMAGWAIPDPAVMGRGLINLIRALLPFGGNK
jgi:hypothetical protein